MSTEPVIIEDMKDWLGCEPNHFDIDVEEQGIKDILVGLTNEEREQITKEDKSMPIRYFRSEKGNVKTAITRIRKTLQWREEIGIKRMIRILHPNPDDEPLNADDTEFKNKLLKQISTGYFVVRGYDKDGRALMCSKPTLTLNDGSKPDLDFQFLHTIYQIERAIACTRRKSAEINCGRSLDKYVYITDYTGFQSKHNPPFSLLSRIFAAYKDHYPECVHCSYLLHPNFLMRTAFALVKPFLDTSVKNSVQMVVHEKDFKPLQDSIGESTITKIETCFTQMKPNEEHDKQLRVYDMTEYLNLPLDVAFDE